MQKNWLAIILIILGIIVLAFPILGLVSVSVLTGIGVLFLGLGLLIAGLVDRKTSSGLGLLEIAVGIIALILGLGFILNPGLFSFIAGLIVYMAGLFLVVIGIVALFSKVGGDRWNGIITIIIGLLYLILGYFVSSPFWLGVLIGLWLLITGILLLFQKNY